MTPTLRDIEEARTRIRDSVNLTPCSPSAVFADLLPCTLAFKFENLQRTGSFKARGAGNKLLQLTEEERAAGVVTASAGNHAQAVAYHAARLGVPATVVMPVTTPLIKVSNTRRHGATIALSGNTLTEAMVEARRLEADEGLIMVHPYDDEEVIAGQGTIALEILEQCPGATHVVVPIGGGGVISGVALGLKAHRPNIKVIGVEAAAAPSARMSRDQGHIVDAERGETIADGIAVKRLGELTYPIVEELVDDIVVVEDEQIASAILMLLEREKMVVEGAGAVPLAALLAGYVDVSSADTVVPVLCGGNIDSNIISRIIDRGLVADGRLVRLMVKVRDRPGALAGLTRLAAELGANVLEIAHRRAFADISVGDVGIVMHLETRGREHVDEIIAALEALGHSVEEDH